VAAWNATSENALPANDEEIFKAPGRTFEISSQKYNIHLFTPFSNKTTGIHHDVLTF